MDVLSAGGRRFLSATAPEHTPVQAAMADLAEEWDFPIIGPAAGAVLRLLARLTDASRVFEFGSGFGYSATWFLRGGAETVICTEFDEKEATRGREFAKTYGYDDAVTFEIGDAMATIDRYDGPFDIVLIDHQKQRYRDAYHDVLPKVRPGGAIVADNITRGPLDFERIVAHVDEGTPLPTADTDAATNGIGRYVDTVCTAEDVETAILPVGSGLAVSTKRP